MALIMLTMCKVNTASVKVPALFAYQIPMVDTAIAVHPDVDVLHENFFMHQGSTPPDTGQIPSGLLNQNVAKDFLTCPLQLIHHRSVKGIPMVRVQSLTPQA